MIFEQFMGVKLKYDIYNNCIINNSKINVFMKVNNFGFLKKMATFGMKKKIKKNLKK